MGLTTEDRLEIQELVARYNHAIDSGEGSAFAATFTASGSLDIGHQIIGGRDDLESFAKALPVRFHAPRHITSNLVLEGDGSQATMRAYVQMYVLSGEPPQPGLSASGKYEDELSKEGGRWLFVRRVFVRDL